MLNGYFHLKQIELKYAKKCNNMGLFDFNILNISIGLDGTKSRGVDLHQIATPRHLSK